jgi:molecular chaperone HscB
MNIDLTRNYFELFGFAEKFSIDQEQLAEKYRALQSELHPDRFVNANDQDRRMSVQTTAFVNEAYATLKSDLKRAHYLLQLIDIDFNADTETSDDAEFLMQTMQLHEEVETASHANDPLLALAHVSKQLEENQQKLIKQFAQQFSAQNLKAAKDTALKLQFYERLTNQVRKKQEQLEQELL